MNIRNNRIAEFSVRSVPRDYKKDKEGGLRQLSSGVGSCSRELRESPELAVGRITEKWQERNQAVNRRLHCVLQ
jgi:hypothetical protein